MLELPGPCDERTEVEPEGLLDLAALPFSGVALPVRDCRAGSPGPLAQEPQWRRSVAGDMPLARNVRARLDGNTIRSDPSCRVVSWWKVRSALSTLRARSEMPRAVLGFPEVVEDFPLLGDGILRRGLAETARAATIARDSGRRPNGVVD